jgi:hypothetical protein
MRYEWHVTPTERDDRFVVFDAATASLLRVGVDLDEIYQQNNRNFEPRARRRVGCHADGRTVLRAAYARAVDEPGTTAVRDTAGNPPFAAPLTATGSIPLDSAVARLDPPAWRRRRSIPLPERVDASWNVNVQRQLARATGRDGGLFRFARFAPAISRNLNQPVDGVRPFASLASPRARSARAPRSATSPRWKAPVFRTTRRRGSRVTKRLSRGLQFDTSYTWSKSLDTNSLNSSGFAVQDGYDIAKPVRLVGFRRAAPIRPERDLRAAVQRARLTRGWQVATIVQSQSGNPVNIVTSNSSLNGVPNTVRPDVTGPIRIIGSVDQWFDPSVFVAVNRFGNLGETSSSARPSTTRTVADQERATGARVRLQFRVDAFDVFNHPNFGPPGNIVGSPTFGKITRTRLPTGEAGSSRQMQLSARRSVVLTPSPTMLAGNTDPVTSTSSLR